MKKKKKRKTGRSLNHRGIAKQHCDDLSVNGQETYGLHPPQARAHWERVGEQLAEHVSGLVESGRLGGRVQDPGDPGAKGGLRSPRPAAQAELGFLHFQRRLT